MADKRKDFKGRNLRDGEDQMKDGRYRFRYYDKNGVRQAVYSWRLVSTDKAPAGKRDGLSLREKEEAIEKDSRDGIDGRKAAQVTLNEIFDLYMAGKHELKQSTRTNYNYMYKNYVSDSLGKKKIGSIKYSDIKAFYNSLIREKGFKPNSMEIINTILHPTFTLAVRDGYIRTNPTDGVMAEIKKSHNWEKPKRHALTIEEQEAFINYMSGSDIYRHWLPLFTVFLGTGCRVGEIIGLRWKDCDFESRTISINHNLVYRQQDSGNCEMHITTPKTAAGCRTINPQTINRAIERIYKAANEEEAAKAKAEHRKPLVIRHFSVHNLRHTFCTRFCENETNIKLIQDIMGHSDISTTMNIYAEATEAKKKEAFDNLEGKIKIS